MKEFNTIVFDTAGYMEAIRDRERHRVTFETIAIRTRMERRKMPFELPADLRAVKTPSVTGGHVFKICKA